MTRFQELFSSLAGSAMARQMQLADFLGDRGWSVDLTAGEATFGTDLRYPIQLLGTESHLNDTWLWAWANPSDLPTTLLEAAEQLRDYGQQQSVMELSQANLDLAVANGHQLSMVASGLVRKTCYFRGPYENGALYFLIFGLPAELFQRSPVERVCTALMQVLESFEHLDHRIAAETFLQEQGFALSTIGDCLHAVRDDASTIDLTFESEGRITEVKGMIPGPASN